MTVSSVNNTSGVITVTSTPSCTQNQVYLVPANSGVTTTTIANNIFWTSDSTTFGYGITYMNTPMYSLTQDGETLEVSLEEWNLSQKAAFDYIKKQREYKKDFEDLLS
jgi:hypothetical protein